MTQASCKGSVWCWLGKAISCLTVLGLNSGCAVLHHVQLGNIDNTRRSTPIDVKISEVGVSLDDVRSINDSLGKKGSKQLDEALKIIALFQMGPQTGNPTYNDKYAKDAGKNLADACKGGLITGLTSIREMRKYPVVSGEIVKFTGQCIR